MVNLFLSLQEADWKQGDWSQWKNDDWWSSHWWSGWQGNRWKEEETPLEEADRRKWEVQQEIEVRLQNALLIFIVNMTC